MIRAAIADDHAIVRKGLRQVLSGEPDVEVVGEAANHGEVMQLVRQTACDVLILDIAMPGKNGIETLKQVKRELPKLPVLMLSTYPEEQYAIRALKAGAAGYLTKMTAAERIVEAVRQVAGGRKYVSAELAEALADSINRDNDVAPHEYLSDREFQTLRLIAMGRTLAQIGEEHALSPKTVSVYRARVVAKLGLHSNAELTRYALQHGLID